MRNFLPFLLAISLISCNSTPPAEGGDLLLSIHESSRHLNTRPDIPDPAEIHRLSPEQTADFLSFFNNPSYQQLSPNRRILSFMDARITGFTYHGETRTARESFSLLSGNCLSLAILTTALARLANVAMEYQLMDDEPVFELQGSLIQKGVHVRTLLLNDQLPADAGLLLLSRGITIDYFPSQGIRFIRNLKEEEYLAMYYRNIAVEALQSDDLHSAYWYAREALVLAPASADTLNTLAIVHRRAGLPETAGFIYQHALQVADNKLTLLKNYYILLAEMGRQQEADRVLRQLNRMDDPNPFNWFHLARDAFADNNYENAISYYQHALDRAPYLHEAHLGIARSYLALGRTDEAVVALRQALDNAGRLQARNFYKGKLASFPEGSR